VIETIHLFQHSKLILGPHGAGFANMVWAPLASKPRTIIEFLHSFDPLLCYWHTANALGLEYWMIPVPESHWAENLNVPVDEVLSILDKYYYEEEEELNKRNGHHHHHHKYNYNDVTSCPAGYYAPVPGADCRMCGPGRFSKGGPALWCETCHPGTFNNLFASRQCFDCNPGEQSIMWVLLLVLKKKSERGTIKKRKLAELQICETCDQDGRNP